MLREIGMAVGMLGMVSDLFKKDNSADAAGSGEFAALMNLQTGLGASSAFSSAGSGMNVADSMRAGTEEAWGMLKDMTDGGLEGAMRWAMEKIREKVMEDMGVSEESLAAMNPAERSAMEDKIAEEVEKRMKVAMGVAPDGRVDEAKMADFKTKLMDAVKAYSRLPDLSMT